MILVIADLRFVLMEECPPFPTTNASQSVRDAYDCWTNANDKAHLYILASMSNILSKKHGIMVTAQMNEAVFNEKSQVFYILKSLPKSFLQFCSNVEMNKIERFVPSSFGSKKIQKRKGGKRKGPTIAVEGKGKAKETSSFKQLEEGEMTLKVETGDVISARAVEDARYGYLYLMEHKSDALEKFKKDKAEVENLLTPGTPQQNGVSKMRNRTLLDMFKSLQNLGLSNTRVSDKSQEVRTSFKVSQFVGYPKETRGGIFFDLQENRVFVSTNVTFLEEDHMRDHKPRSKLVLNEATDESTRVVDEVCPLLRVDETTTSGQSHPSQSLRMPRRCGRIVSQPNRYLGFN
ncbi:Retrovirus-related Pol polyprotein from transposon TNT 1-94 [Cucumis melo var. makuwa]|uniref:Retrovirus-related Pol polyprotein from transposon TNT 1-94 n=1 Tax=Cucumis melo var. makuwa TaxID=1194695 RepID=A0A5D3BA70_CUCMM|nr:Retrovirus-related Pol polyprotein from transposon TNT 1-94 [Cucumis melo var. makuwa]